MSDIGMIFNRTNITSFRVKVILLITLVLLISLFFILENSYKKTAIKDNLVTVSNSSTTKPISNSPSLGNLSLLSQSNNNNASNSSNTTKVTVNGTDIPVPSNGNVTKSDTSNGSTVNVSVNSQNSNTDVNSSSSSSVQVESQTTTENDGGSN